MATNKSNMIVFDMKESIRRQMRQDARYNFTKTAYESGLNIYRCLSAGMDKNALKAFGSKFDTDKDKDKAILDIWFPKYDPQNNTTKLIAKKELIDAVTYLKQKNFKVLKSVLFSDPDDEEHKLVGKILVDIPIGELKNLKDLRKHDTPVPPQSSSN